MKLTEITEYKIMPSHKVDKSIIAARVVYWLRVGHAAAYRPAVRQPQRDMVRSKSGFAVLVRIGIVVVGLIIYFWVYPRVSSLFPKAFEVHSTTLVVEGRYFQLDVDGVNSVYISEGRMVVDGFDLDGFKPVNQAPVMRPVPSEYSHITNPDSSWHFVYGISNPEGFTTRLYVRDASKDTIAIQLPAMNDIPTWRSYSNMKDTTLIVLASGNWKQTKKVYVGYIIASHKRRE
jgi:hypothetical protein